MYPTLLQIHSVLRFFVLLFLLLVIVRALMGWMGKREFTVQDGKLGTWLMILTHSQFLAGLALYFISPAVIFSGSSMGDSIQRYWLVEHVSMMLLAVILITVARSTAKRMTDAVAKHKRMFIFNTIALFIIIAAISMSGRGFFSHPDLIN